MFFDRFRIFATSLCILPACAGVNLTDAMRQRIYENSPRMRGANPEYVSYSPTADNSPRMRGGQPLLPIVEFARSQFSPHARGSTLFIDWPFDGVGIHPACAGVNLA